MKNYNSLEAQILLNLLANKRDKNLKKIGLQEIEKREKLCNSFSLANVMIDNLITDGEIQSHFGKGVSL